jgi:hypothetical protein
MLPVRIRRMQEKFSDSEAASQRKYSFFQSLTISDWVKVEVGSFYRLAGLVSRRAGSHAKARGARSDFSSGRGEDGGGTTDVFGLCSLP